MVRAWVQRAEALGFKAVMVTVDAPRLGRREADERNRFTLPPHLQLRNMEVLSKGAVAQARASTVRLHLDNHGPPCPADEL